MGKCIIGTCHVKVVKNIICHIFFYISGVAKNIIQHKLVKPLQRLPRNIMVKLHLKTIPVRIGSSHLRQTCVSFGSDPDIGIYRPVHGNITEFIFLRQRGFQHFLKVPFVYLNSDLHDLILVK